jgi:hypothetical protein
MIFANSQENSKGEKSDKITKVSSVIYAALNGENYEKGKIIASENLQKTKAADENKITQTGEALSVNFVSRKLNLEKDFMRKNKSLDLKILDDDSEITIPINRGKLLHGIFAEIKTKNDIETAINKFVFEGAVAESEKTELKNFVQTAISQTQVEQWYSGKYKLFNECTIIAKNADEKIESKRPDRVMIDGKNAIIVDFKFGKKNKKYNTQVAEYMKLMREMNYESVSGFLWYVDEKEVEEVKSL